ncbi:hypothetical protein ACX40Y_06200 [Sphingomonas sp. RS6]
MSTAAQWGVAAAILLAIPFLIRVARRNSRGRAGAAMLLIGLAFGHLFDPAKGEATEQIEKRRQRREEAGHDGA